MAFTPYRNLLGTDCFPVMRDWKAASGYRVYKGAALTFLGYSALCYASGIDKVVAISQVSATSAEVTADFDLQCIPVNKYQVWENINKSAIAAGLCLIGSPIATGIPILTGSYGTALALAPTSGGLARYLSGGAYIQIYNTITAGVSATYVIFNGAFEE